MNSIDELIKTTIDSINIGRKTVVFSVPAKRRSGQYCYPFGKGTPKAEILATNKDKDVVSLDAVDLLAFLIATNGNEVIEVTP